MSKSFPSFAEPGMIRWCRKNAHLTTADVAAKLDRQESEIIAWEDGTESPTFAQLTRFAQLCKRPVAVFYLPEPPRDFTILKDFRRFQRSKDREFSPALAYLIRTCRERQEWMSGYLNSEGIDPLEFVGSLSSSESIQDAGKSLRHTLSVSLEDQFAFRNDDEHFRFWRERAEDVGVCVFVASRAGVSTEEMRGFALIDRHAPIVVVNGRERSYAARTFTLLHELAHIFIGEEGVSNSVLSHNPRTKDQKTEVFCNAVAAEALVPATDISVRVSAYGNDLDAAISHLSRAYRVSEQVIARRLYDLNFASKDFFLRKILEFSNRRTDDEDEESRDVQIPQPIQVINNIGRRFARAALSAFHSGSINGPDLRDLLNMRLQHINGLEARLVRASGQ